MLDLDAIPPERPLYARATACGDEVRPSAEGRKDAVTSRCSKITRFDCWNSLTGQNRSSGTRAGYPVCGHSITAVAGESIAFRMH